MRLEDITAPADLPALHFIRETAALRAENQLMRAALADVLALLADGDAEPEHADRVAATVRAALRGLK